MMTEQSFYRLEREVEAARAKLATDLSILRSPATSDEFTTTLKQEAKSSFQATIQAVIEDVKARAAANPSAALAIGAGLAWRVFRHPPIAAALIGAGLISLFRTAPVQTNGDVDYFSQAKARLREQATQVADTASEQVAAMGGSVAQKAAELAGATEERIQEWTNEAGSLAKQAATELRQRAASISSQVSGVMSELGESQSSSARSVISDIAAATRHADRAAQQAISDPEPKNNLLLGAAGAAIVAALSIALQRRITQADS
jgi:hypothetical protein